MKLAAAIERLPAPLRAGTDGKGLLLAAGVGKRIEMAAGTSTPSQMRVPPNGTMGQYLDAELRIAVARSKLMSGSVARIMALRTEQAEQARKAMSL